MARILSLITMLALCCSFTACGFLPFGGGGGSAYKPAEVMDSAFVGDLADAKPGKSVTYVTTPGDMKVTVKVVGKEGDLLLIEHWTEMPSMSYGLLYKVSGEKKVKEAYAAAKDDKEWTKITVKETPKAQGGEGQKPEIKESDEKKEVKAGNFSSRRIDVKGSNYASTAWYSKDVPKLYMFSPEHGGMVAMEASGSKTSLEAKADDAKASTIEMPKK
jgi:hypothetical protein